MLSYGKIKEEFMTFNKLFPLRFHQGKLPHAFFVGDRLLKGSFNQVFKFQIHFL